MKPTRRMASIRTGCWRRGYRVPYEPETVSAKITEPAGENSKVSIWQQYFDGVYYGVILADTVVPVWVIVRETRRGAVSGAAVGVPAGRERCPLGADHDDRQTPK